MKIYKTSQEWYTIEIAQNTKDPNILRDILKRGKDDWVSENAVRNPNCPPEALAEILKRGNNDNVSCYAALNPNCPPEALKEVLKRGNYDSVSCNAASNPNCPPETLAEVLNRGKNDGVSCYAAFNLKCPPEALANVLKRGNNDIVSGNAVSNPNCPPEALKDVLKRGKDNWVSRSAASNPNCPPEILAEVLKRGKNDIVSGNAAQNPNCPPLAMVLWMKATGKISDYDPNNPKHFLEQEETKEDKDLEELKKLVTKNKSWYKIAKGFEDKDGNYFPDIPKQEVDVSKVDKTYFDVPWVNVDSSFIKQVAYYPDQTILDIRLKDGKRYAYIGVSKRTYKAFLKSKSKGQFFNNVIKEKYRLIR